MISLNLDGTELMISESCTITKFTIVNPSQKSTAFPSFSIHLELLDDGRKISISLEGVVQLYLGEIGPAGMDVGELYVIDVREQGWEAANYKIGDELTGWYCYCRSIQLA